MLMAKTIYHPSFEPRISWLRAMLLFYDSVHSIIPQNAAYVPTPGIAQLCEKLPDVFTPLAPTDQDLECDWQQYHALTAVLRETPKGGKGKKSLQAKFDWPEGVPRLDLGNSVKVHNDKMADMLVYDLIGMGLAQRTDDSEWLQVDKRVADLILSMLADRMARKRPGVFFTSSDREAAFAVAAMSDLNHSRLAAWNPEALLASAILTVEIPSNIADMPINRYIDIRNRYHENRDIFRLAMQELRNLYLEGSFHEPDAFRQQLENVVKDFSKKTQRLREQESRRRVIQWAPITIGGIVSIAAAAITTPIVAISAAGVGVVLQIFQTSHGQSIQGTNISRAQAMLVQLDSELKWNRNWLGRLFTR